MSGSGQVQVVGEWPGVTLAPTIEAHRAAAWVEDPREPESFHPTTPRTEMEQATLQPGQASAGGGETTCHGAW